MCVQFVEENRHPLFSYPQVYQAYKKCRRTKRNSLRALAFELNPEEFLLRLADELRAGHYKPGTSICFYIRKPKCREIFAAQFRDRIVHHLVYQHISPVWERIFIHHSYACRPAKGTHAAAQSLQKFIRMATSNGKHRAYYLKMDIKNFFMSIDRSVLFQMLLAKCTQGALKELLRVVAFHNPTKNYLMQDRECLRAMLPKQKSLFYAKPGCGLPIGNLTSQFFANVYLNAMDQFIKHRVKARFYLRYVDDFILVHSDPGVLHAWKEQIDQFLQEELKLSVNSHATHIAPVSGGVDFAGFIIRHKYKLVRRRVVGNLKVKLRRFEGQLVRQRSDAIFYRFDQEILDACLSTVNSYLGHFRHAKTHRLIQKLWQHFPFLECYFRLCAYKVIRRDRPLRKIPSMNRQIRWICDTYSAYLCLIQVGCYYECFFKDAEMLSTITGFTLRKNWRGFSYSCGFPGHLLKKVVDKLRMHKVSYAIIHQTGRELYRTKERLPALLVRYEKKA